MNDNIVSQKLTHRKLQPIRKEKRVTNIESSEKDEHNEYIKSKLTEAAKLVKLAKVHARGTKSGDALRRTVRVLDDMLQSFGLDFSTVTRRTVKQPYNVCPEIYKGSTFGYPFFYRGFEQSNCSYRVAEEKLVTIVIQLDNFRVETISRLLDDIINYNRNMSVVVGAKVSELPQFKNDRYSQILFKTYKTTTSKGRIWNDIIEHVQTPYVLVARDLIRFDNDTRIHRLIREIERLQLTSAGGASRDSNGFWKLGCLQRAYKNYTLVYEEGYQESIHECVFCDHIENSFVISKTLISKFKFDESLSQEGMWEDFFLRAEGESVVCPDSMFYSNRTIRSSRVLDWKEFGGKYQLRTMKFVSSKFEVDFNCPKPIKCFLGTGFSVTSCCLEELANLITFIMNACEKAGAICELQEGTLLGAVKLNKVLPWERDADITFLTANYSQLQKLKATFESAGYAFRDGSALWCCADNRTAGGKFRIGSGHWHAELYGQHIMDSELLMQNSIKPTKVLLNGNWVNVPRNPGLHARNRYGHEIYAHAQHWIVTGKSSGWINYDTSSFTNCHKSGDHNCLDRYNSDGNLQFTDPIP